MKRAPPNIKDYVGICFNAITKYDWDNVVVIVGDTGRGKSNLALWILDEWLRLQDKNLAEQDLKNYLGMTAAEFADNIASVKQYDIVIHDEAGDISSRTAMSKTNILFLKAYQVIRGANLMTVLCIPSIWYLDTYFRRSRVRQMFFVYKRVKNDYAMYRYWAKSSYRDMIERFRRSNSTPDDYDYSYDMTGRFTKYTGILASKYKDMKREKIDLVRAELPKMLNDISGGVDVRDSRKKRIFTMLNSDLDIDKICEIEGVSLRTVQRYKSALMSSDKKESTIKG